MADDIEERQLPRQGCFDAHAPSNDWDQWYTEHMQPEFGAIHQKLDRLLSRLDTQKRFSACSVTPEKSFSGCASSRLAQVLGTKECDSARSSSMHLPLERTKSGQKVYDRQLSLDSLQQRSPIRRVQHQLSCESIPRSSAPTQSSNTLRLPAEVADNPPGWWSSRSSSPTPIERTLTSISGMTRSDMEDAVEKVIYKPRWLTCLDQIWRTLEDPESSRLALWLAKVTPVLVMSTVFVTLLQTIESPPLHGVPAAVIETAIDSIFLLEFVLRFVTCPNRSIFFFDCANIIDLAAGAPLFLRAAVGFVLTPNQEEDVPGMILLCLVPIIRLLKTLRRFEKFHLLLQAFNLAIEALPVLLYMLFVITLVFSVLIYLVEPRDNIAHLSTAVWLTIVTMTTVGYGDIIPESPVGSAITGVLIVITVLYMAVPLGIIGDAFTQTWNDRDRILLTQRTRERLRQWGYEASDIPLLFHASRLRPDGDPDAGVEDGHATTSLNMQQFREMLKRMRLGFNDERVYQLFQSFDRDHTGTIDDREFVRTLFPNAYHSIYHHGEPPSNEQWSWAASPPTEKSNNSKAAGEHGRSLAKVRARNSNSSIESAGNA